MAKEKVNYQDVYDLYLLCSETKNLRKLCAYYGVNHDKFMRWQRHLLWNEKLGKTVQVEQPKVAKVQITGKPCNGPTVKLKVKQPECEPPIKWVKLQLTSGTTLFLINATVLDLIMLNKIKNSSFIFSLIESCKLNDIDLQDYLKHLFECILHGKDCDRKALLPCFYKSEC